MSASNILIVEDSATQRLMLLNTLEEKDYNVKIAKDGLEALNYLELCKKLPDLIISDIIMPNVDGYELCSTIKQLYKEVFIILLTGNSDEEALQKSFDAGAVDFLEKPFNKTELLLRVKNVLRIKKAEDLLKKAMDQLEENNTILKKQSITDELTGLVNRRYLIKNLKNKMYIAERYSTPLSIILFDIDYFKKINDTYGHLVGDEVLVQVALMFKNQMRKTDIIGRFGGEEFLLILPNTTLENGIKVAQNLNNQIKKLKFKNMPDYIVTLSGGICEFNNEIRCEDLLSRVDDLLYVAKNNGRDRIEF